MEVNVIEMINLGKEGGALLFCLLLHTHTHTGISGLWSLTPVAGVLCLKIRFKNLFFISIN